MIEFKGVSKHFGSTQVLHDINLNIASGEVVVIIGPSGSGKSTLLRCINKLEEVSDGQLMVDGLEVNNPKVDERLIRQEAGMVFQQFHLFPQMTALQNVAFGPVRVRGAAARKQSSSPPGCWPRSAWLTAPITTRPNCPVGSNSALPLPGRWR